jgi:hypothetical protein
MSRVAHQLAEGYRTLRLPIAEADHEQFITDSEFAKEQLDRLYRRHPDRIDKVDAPEPSLA